MIAPAFFIAYVPFWLLRHHHDDGRHGVVVASRVVLQRPSEPVLVDTLGRPEDLRAKEIVDVDYAETCPLACQSGDTCLYVERTGDDARVIGHHLVTVHSLGHGTDDRIEPALVMEQLSQYGSAGTEKDTKGPCQLHVCLNLPCCFLWIGVPVHKGAVLVPRVGAEEPCQA